MHQCIQSILIWKTQNGMRRKNILLLNLLYAVSLSKGRPSEEKDLQPKMSDVGCCKRQEKFEALENVKMTNVLVF